jgi:acyl-CoA synthetase (AMP-forming)/AMP-acid ligase II/acyl carrier protein
MTAATFIEMIAAQAAAASRAPALLALDRAPLAYGPLLQHLNDAAAQLAALGIGRADRVAVVLPNGPEMAGAFLAVAGAAGCAPLNPAYRASEFEFYLADLEARAVIVPAGGAAGIAAVEAARRLGVAVIELSAPPGAPAGVFNLSGAAVAPAAERTEPRPGDVALLLHTSGTTSRPKLVPLTHGNLAASAANVAAALALTPADRVLNVMPLFHIHGLVAALLASLAAGASVVCTPGFEAPRFFDWLRAAGATWYTAVPTIHQAVLARAREDPGAARGARLRLIRSASAALPPQVMAELEAALAAPVIEAYGMTEAAHQMASNPLPPRARKPRSVGLPAGPEVAIMAEDQPRLLPAGELGEIVIRGANVTPGYAANPEANARAFSGGWLRTGDQGCFDADGYLFITGRLKELINRGGEKIAPVEVEEALLDHPGVAQAVAFALPDARLGEDVAAAVTAQPGAALDERELRRWVARALSDFKVPRRVLVLDELPKGPTGKLQRLGLAERLGLTVAEAGAAEAARPAASEGADGAPQTEIEARLAELWQGTLGRARVGRGDRFIELGGDSILAAQLVARVSEAFGVEVALIDFFDAPTIADQARLLEAALLAQMMAATEEGYDDDSA